MFPDNLHVVDPMDGKLYVVENDVVSKSMSVVKGTSALLVCQNMADIYTVNRDNNSISRIKNGEAIGDISVGMRPYGICEDPDGLIYVTNYGDNTVSVIKNGRVDGYPIHVDNGPRGIISDATGNIYVACYLTNTVCQIVGRTVTKRIQVPFNPDGITCSPFGEIWVACSGSNVAVKIVRGEKKLTVDTGKRPVAIVTDKKGNVFTANYEDDTVSIISTTGGGTQIVPVGDGPMAITINSQGLIYVTSNLSSELVYKINPKTAQVIDTIHVCKSQVAFGDFTGCATYNVFHPYGEFSGNISTAAISNVVQALRPTFYFSQFDETKDNITATVTSDLLDLNKFNHLKLNGVAQNSDGSFTIPTEDIGAEFRLTGYFEEDDANPVIFVSMSYNHTFLVKVGMVDDNYENYIEIKRKVIDFAKDDSVAMFVQQPDEGHMVVMVPQRVYQYLRDGLIAQGNFNISEAWDPEATGQDTNLVNHFYAEVQDPADQGWFYVLINNLKTSGGQSWMFNFYKTENASSSVIITPNDTNLGDDVANEDDISNLFGGN
jgi:hypothetical protein